MWRGQTPASERLLHDQRLGRLGVWFERRPDDGSRGLTMLGEGLSFGRDQSPAGLGHCGSPVALPALISLLTLQDQRGPETHVEALLGGRAWLCGQC